MPDRLPGLGAGTWPDVKSLPEHQQALHRAQQAAIRAERQERLHADSDDERRWPGLVNPDDERQTTRRNA